MKKCFIIANWKSNRTTSQAKEWLETVEKLKVQSEIDKEVIVCPPFTLLSDLKSLIFNLKSSIKLGAQDISPFGPGAYTGAVNGVQIKEFCDYVLIGHSERRKHFHEDEKIITEKVHQAQKNSLHPIFCVQDENASVPDGVSIIAYEPVFAIGTGNPDTPENTENIAKKIKSAHKEVVYVLYGGSINSTNVYNFTSQPSIDGVLVGGASLEAKEFLNILQNA